MGKYIVSYNLPNDERVIKTEVTAVNVLHAEKIVKQQVGKKIFVISVASKS